MSSNYNDATFKTVDGTHDRITINGLNMTDVKRRLVNINKNLADFKPKELARLLVKIANDIDHEATMIAAQKLDLEKGCES